MVLRSIPEYNAWTNMKARCANPRHPIYRYYGGRGITVCQRWRESYADFLADIGHRPSPTHTLERLDNNLGYQPGNVTWATRTDQSRNTRHNVHLTAFGKTMLLIDWAAEIGVHYMTIHTRLKRGWSIDRALSTAADPSFIRNHKLLKNKAF